MKTFKKYLLDLEKTRWYLEDNLETKRVGNEVEKTNELSDLVCKHILAMEGKLSALVLGEPTQDELYEFWHGGKGGACTKELIELIYEEIQLKSHLSCMVDAVDETFDPNDKNLLLNDSLYVNFGAHFQGEVYYSMQSSQATKELIKQFCMASGIMWHSLCLLTSYVIPKREDKSITRGELEEACARAEMILILAYDAEGYILWEKA